MLIEDRFVIKRPVSAVWDFVMNPSELASCIPGCDKIEAIDDKHYRSLINVKVGPISVRFDIENTLVEIDPFKRIKMIGTGTDRNKKGYFKQETEIIFDRISENETDISYRSEVSVVGIIATFGEKIMRGKTKALGAQFLESIKRKLGSA
jgi:carbon monoxide dehydrogenase subunit G